MSPEQIPTVKLYLIRHGETAWSLTGQHTGRTDIPLTAQGEKEARNLVPWLRDVQFARVLTSPRRRAQRTCALAGLGQDAEIESNLAEWDYGDYEGKRAVDIRREHPGWNVFHDGCPGGETPAEVSARADRLIKRLCSMEGNVGLFSHGQFGLALAARWIGLPILDGQHFLFGTASVSILSFSVAHPGVAVIGLWNASPAILDRIHQ
jgi:probable phosphoglycerate mutase